MASKRIRVVTSRDQETKRATQRRVISTDTNPKVPRLTPNEQKARRIATTSTMGFGLRNAGDIVDSGAANFYSPQLSTDFLEKPQNLRERRAFYRFFYNTNEIIGQAIDIHSTLPLSKLRLNPPKGKNKHQNKYIFKFFTKMCDDMKLFKSLIEVTHEYFLFGNAFLFCEDDDWKEGINSDNIGQKKEEAQQRAQLLKDKFDITDKNPLYKGWKKILVLPPDQVRVRKLPLTDDVAIEYMPDPETRKFLTSDIPIDPQDPTKRLDYSISQELREKVRQSGVIPLDTDPYTGSHVFHLARKKSQYEPLGVSIVERCINTLVLMDKLRQAQTSIASRHMTPMRVIWAEDLNPDDIDNLREQVDLALVDPDFSIIANYEIHWEEMGSNGRLLDVETEMESSLNRLFAGLGITREMLTGEGTYTGSRVSLEIMNTMYLLFREVIQDFIENNLFKPVAKKKGFIEHDEYGNEVLLYPKVSFTRLAIRDNEQFFDAAFQLYQKGSISIDLILDVLNIDPEATREKIEQDLFTVNDSLFNEMMRNLYTNVAAPLVEETNVTEKLAKYLNLEKTEKAPPAEGESRFSSTGSAEHQKKLTKIMKYLMDNPQEVSKIYAGSNGKLKPKQSVNKRCVVQSQN